MSDREIYKGCYKCKGHDKCPDAFQPHSVKCNAYGKESHDYIKREDAIKIMACEMKAEAESQGCEGVGSIADYIPEATAWMNDAPAVEPTVDKDELIRLIQGAVYDGEDCARLMKMVELKKG